MPKYIEMNVRSIGAFNKDCAGCQKCNKDVMISVEQTTKWLGDLAISVDLFLSQKQTIEFIKELQKAVNHNSCFTTLKEGDL